MSDAETKDQKFWYRYEGVAYAAPLDEYEMPIGSGRKAIRLDAYRVAKETPKGVQLDMGFFGGDAKRGWKFVLLHSRKRFACPTKEEALESFIARKKRQHGILMARAVEAESFMHLALKELSKLRPQDIEYKGTCGVCSFGWKMNAPSEPKPNATFCPNCRSTGMMAPGVINWRPKDGTQDPLDAQ